MAGRTGLAAVTDPSTPAVVTALESLRRDGVEVVVCGRAAGDPAAGGPDGDGRGGGVRVLVAGSVTPVDVRVLDLFPDLRLVVRTGAGYENVDVEGLRAAGVEVARATGRNVESVAEFVYAGLLGLIRRVGEADRAVRSRDFGFRERVLGGELHGRTLGVLGFGPIGRRVAQIGAHGFGMRVIVHHPWRRRPLPDGFARVDGLADFLTRTDVLSVHCRLSEESRGLVAAAELELLGSDGYLVNTARGEIVDVASLAAALTDGRLAGAVLDVFPTEPPEPDSPLFGAPNLVLSPHLAGHTVEGVAGNGAWAAGVATAYLRQGRPPPVWSICPGRTVSG